LLTGPPTKLLAGYVQETIPAEVPATLAMLTLLIGLLQLLCYLLRASAILDLVSHPVLVGFTNGSALTIAVKQLNSFLGIPLPPTQSVLDTLIELLPRLGQTQPYALLVGAVSLVLLVALRYLWPLFPRNAAVVALAALLTWALQLDAVWELPVVGELPKGSPPVSLPDFGKFLTLLPHAIVIMLVAMMEHIAIAKALARKAHGTCDPAQEVLSQAVSNVCGAFASAMPVAGSFSRSSLSEQSGARTQLSSLVTGIVALCSMLFLTGLFEYIPNAALAAVIMAAVIVMFAPREALRLMRLDPLDAATVLLTFVGVLCIGPDLGILLGLVFSIFGALYLASRPRLQGAPLDGLSTVAPADRLGSSTADLAAKVVLPSPDAAAVGLGDESGSAAAVTSPPAPGVLLWRPELRAFMLDRTTAMPAAVSPPANRWQAAWRAVRRGVGLLPVPPPVPTAVAWRDVPLRYGLIQVAVHDSLWFPNAAYIAEQLVAAVESARAVLHAATIRGVLLDARRVNHIDAVGLEMLATLTGTLHDVEAMVVLCGLTPALAQRLHTHAPALLHGAVRPFYLVATPDDVTPEQLDIWDAAAHAAVRPSAAHAVPAGADEHGDHGYHTDHDDHGDSMHRPTSGWRRYLPRWLGGGASGSAVTAASHHHERTVLLTGVWTSSK